MTYLKRNLWWIALVVVLVLEAYSATRWPMVTLVIHVVVAVAGALLLHAAMRPPRHEPKERQAPHDD